MSVVKLNIDIDHEKIKEQIDKQIEERLQHSFIFVDVSTLSKMTCMSASTLERDILSDARMKLLERRKERGKKYYFYPECLDAIKEIVDEW